VGGAGIEGWAGDIKVEPRQAGLDEFTEEEACNQHSTHAIADVRHICHWRIQ
jgi:hypothetical protein